MRGLAITGTLLCVLTTTQIARADDAHTHETRDSRALQQPHRGGQAPVYRIKNLCSFGEACRAFGLNVRSEVAGTVWAVTTEGEPRFRVFVWYPRTDTIKELGTLGGLNSNGGAINKRGQVAGMSDLPDGVPHPFFWDPATDEMEDVGTLTQGLQTSPNAMNDSGQIVGYGEVEPFSELLFWNLHAFFWDPNSKNLLDLGTDTRESIAIDINNKGLVTGVFGSDFLDYVETGHRHDLPFVWDARTQEMQFLPIDRFGSHEGIGQRINDNGQVMGLVRDSHNASTVAVFRWDPHKREMKYLDSTTPVSFLQPSDMNEIGQIVGGYNPEPPGGEYRQHPFFWDPDTEQFKDLGILGVANAINNSGWVAGTSATEYPNSYAFLWAGDVSLDLNNVVAPDDPLRPYVTLTEGVAINDAGTILALGVDSRESTIGPGYKAYVLTLTVPFASFKSRTNIDLRPAHGKDWFDTFAPFTLGADSNGISPLKEPVTIQIGTFSTTIPAGSFKLINGDFTFQGRIGGVKLYARIRLIKGKSYEFFTYANCASLTGTSNPVRVGLTIGDDSGSALVTAKFGPRPS